MLNIWRFDIQKQKLMFISVSQPDMLKDIHFLTADFTNRLPMPVESYYIMIGDSDGTLIAYDTSKNTYVDIGTSRGRVISGAIGSISIKNESVVIASQDGEVLRYPITGSIVLPDDPQQVIQLSVESAIVSLSMDDANVEGLVGTEAGAIHYVHFGEQIIIPLVSSNNYNQDSANFIKCDPNNDQIFFTNCGTKSDECKIFTN